MSLHVTIIVMQLATDTELISIHDLSRDASGIVVVVPVIVGRNHKQAGEFSNIECLSQWHQGQSNIRHRHCIVKQFRCYHLDNDFALSIRKVFPVAKINQRRQISWGPFVSHI